MVDDGPQSAAARLNVPVPDPSSLTTQQLLRELANLREIVVSEITSVSATLTARLDAADTATELRLQTAAGVLPQTERQITHLKELINERFDSVFRMFGERDVRTALASAATDDALKAALQAAKELVNAQGEAASAAAVKSETSFTKQIDQIGTIISTLEKAMDARITELKERIDRGEGSHAGARESGGDEAALRAEAAARDAARRSQSIALASVFVAVVAIVVTVGVAVAVALR